MNKRTHEESGAGIARGFLWFLVVPFLATVAACSGRATSPTRVTLAAVPSATSTQATRPATGRTRAYGGEELSCSAGNALCIYTLEDDSEKYQAPSGDHVLHQTMWLHPASGPDRFVIASRDSEDCRDRLVSFGSPTFAPDGRLFVLAQCSAVSSAIFEIDLMRGTSRFVIDGRIIGTQTANGALHLTVMRFLLDLDHGIDDPAYAGRCAYTFDVDPTTNTAVRIAGPLD